MHSVMNIYMNDLLGEEKELPRVFTQSVTRAVILKDSNDYVTWSEFQSGFPIAVRQRKVLWNRYVSRTDLRLDLPDSSIP